MRTSKRSFFPSKEGKFNEWQLGVCKQCVADAAVWKLNAEMMTQFKNLSALANTLYIANADTAKKNKETRLYKDATFKALKEFIRNVLYPTLKANSLVADVDLVLMGFPSRGFTAHEPIPVPEEVPVLTTDVGKHHGITVYAGLKQKTHLTDSQRRSGIYGFKLKYLVDGETVWQELTSTSLKHTITFPAEYEGKHVEFIAAWVNPRLQEGPWSDTVKALIN
ncbi:hypothetical protein Barb4_02077 [Bacteroidales bacterium Barb4]|nr:hypothetical protein Barb4_02077 [Bacteroidales bacterium Barb4]